MYINIYKYVKIDISIHIYLRQKYYIYSFYWIYIHTQRHTDTTKETFNELTMLKIILFKNWNKIKIQVESKK